MKATHLPSNIARPCRLWRRLGALPLYLLAAACSDDHKPTSSPQRDGATPAGDAAASDARAPAEAVGQSGVQLSKTVGVIDDEEVRKLCSWNNQLAPQLQPTSQQLCMLMAVAAHTPAECEAKLKLCSLTGSSSPPLNDCSKVTASGLSDSCDEVTVDAYEACLLATVELRKQRFSQLSCAQAGTTPGPEMRPAACLSWVDACADLAP